MTSYSLPQGTKEESTQLEENVGTQFSDNFSSTGCSLLIKMVGDKAYTQEVYSEYANYTGVNIYGDKRTCKIKHPRPGYQVRPANQVHMMMFGTK